MRLTVKYPAEGPHIVSSHLIVVIISCVIYTTLLLSLNSHFDPGQCG